MVYGRYTLWLFNIAMENGLFIDGLPIENGGSFHVYVSHNQMVIFSNSFKVRSTYSGWFLWFMVDIAN